MTPEEINDYNRRCAEFLGMYDYSKENEYFEKGAYYAYPEKDRNPSSGYYTILQRTSEGYIGIFNSDWNWIMEVVEVIEKLGYQFDITGNEVGVNSNIMSMENISTGGTMNSYNRSYYPTIISICEEEYSKKGAVVQAINQFLIWYNNEKSD